MVNVFPVPALASSTVVPVGSGPARSKLSGSAVTAGPAARSRAAAGRGPGPARRTAEPAVEPLHLGRGHRIGGVLAAGTAQRVLGGSLDRQRQRGLQAAAIE